MSATESDAFGRCHWCGNMTDSAGCLSVSCGSRVPSAAPGEAVAWGIWHRNGDLVGLKRTREEAEAWCGTSTTYGPPRPLYAAPAPVRVSEAMVEEVVTRIAADPDGTPVRHRLFSAEDVRRAVREGAALAAQEGSRGCQCGHANAEHVAVYSGGVNTLDCTKCDCTVYPRNFPTEEAPRG